ncbi:MAG: SEC-C domain-containing protein [Salinivirgaceae bacterium]|jgi:hypothetical protein|nr:SEC-C domain-containing protein [Salinivirgaceae bacterium]
MSVDIGRNDACHCGSGKKYKKCCLISDQENEKLEVLKTKYIAENTDLPEPWDNPEDWISSDDEDTPYKDPNLTDEQNELLDKWWDDFRLLKDYKAQIAHLNLLFDTMPDLVEYAGLENEAIFELVAPHLKDDKYDDFIAFLLNFKERYPEAYKLADDYYNYYVIVWLLVNDRQNEIPNYLDIYIDKGSEKLAEVVELLRSTNNCKILIPFLEKNYKVIIESEAYWNAWFLIQPLLDNACAPCLKPNIADRDIAKTILNLKNIDYEFIDEIFEPSYWQTMSTELFKPFEPWPNKIPANKTAFNELLNKVSTQYLGFLISKKEFSSNYSFHLYHKINSFIFEYYEQNSKKSKSLFKFSIKKIDETIITLTKNMMWLNYIELHSLFLTTYYFMEYLELCGNLDSEERTKIQQEISELFNSNRRNFLDYYEEALIIKSIP